jgi:diguanylate cyclase (GGDEF)-like protein/putative nucleotidyltransferase with HDIG domain
MNWSELPIKLKAYIILLTAIAIPISAWAVWVLYTEPHDIFWFGLAILALITIPAFLFVPSANTTLSVGDTYIMAIAMIYGIAPCIAATFFHVLLTSILAPRPKVHIYRVIFNTSSTICVAWLYSFFYHQIVDGSTQITDKLLGAVVLISTFFLANSLLTSIAISWSIKENIGKFWAKTCLPLATDFSVSGIAATGIVLLHEFHKLVPVFVFPLVALGWGYNKLIQARAIEAEKHLVEQEQLYMRTVESLALAVDAKDQTTYGHIRRVKVYAIGLAKLCGINQSNELKAIETGALLHDIGKLAIDDYILNKPGRLTKMEFDKIKLHATAGDEILQQVRFPFPVAKYVRYHHERWDGNGYPDGLKGDEIPLGARILAIADAFDAIRNSRPYKLSMATDEAIEIMRSQSGVYFDPNLVKLLEENIPELEKAAARESDCAPELSFRKYFETVNQTLSASASHTDSIRHIPTELLQLSEFCSSVSGYFPIRDIFPLLFQRIKQLVPYDSCALYLLNSDARLVSAYAEGRHAGILLGHSMQMGMGISGWVAAYRRPMLNTNPSLDFAGVHEDLASLSDTLAIPVIHSGESLGVIAFYAQEPETYHQEHLAILQLFSNMLAPGIREANEYGLSPADTGIDPVTGLPHVSYLAAAGQQLISLSDNNPSPMSLIYLEIRNLRKIIQVYGGDVAGNLLRKIADGMKPELRETDILVRYGNLGFIVFLPGVGNEQASRCERRLKQRIMNQAHLTGQGLTINCGTGIATYPKDGSTIITLFQSAQNTMMSVSDHNLPATDRNVVDFPPRS